VNLEKTSDREPVIPKKDRIAGRQCSKKFHAATEDSQKRSIGLPGFVKKDRCRCRQCSKKIGATPSPQTALPTNIRQNLCRTLCAGPVFSGKNPVRVLLIPKKDQVTSRQFPKKIEQVAEDRKKRSDRLLMIFKKVRTRIRQFRKMDGGYPPGPM
jgi:hypothetical protein